ncbi:hypothetical protein N7505_007272 [Penicillium chrysogenum]|uniref:Uncharacterized protein n=1 Tax=Penicillium chrysogenum TaxID=5076 RepID=A0ABQ8WDV8_PENCH|nr:hypothetical protein N7505_007272 [Penicillium chrysogenum]
MGHVTETGSYGVGKKPGADQLQEVGLRVRAVSWASTKLRSDRSQPNCGTINSIYFSPSAGRD